MATRHGNSSAVFHPVHGHPQALVVVQGTAIELRGDPSGDFDQAINPFNALHDDRPEGHDPTE